VEKLQQEEERSRLTPIDSKTGEEKISEPTDGIADLGACLHLQAE
jgi:hypothetical protein